jgi:hypothetical protein
LKGDVGGGLLARIRWVRNVDLDEVTKAEAKVALVIELGPGEDLFRREESEGRGSSYSFASSITSATFA